MASISGIKWGLLLGAVGILCGCTGAWSASDESASVKNMNDQERNEYRMEYIENFQRTGLNTTPGDANFLRIMVESTKARRGIEVGTATGYGALLMGLAFEANGGELITIDIDPKMVQAAREHLENMGLSEVVEVKEGDALQVLGELEGEFDFLFIDALKRDYLKYFKLAEPKLKPGALIIADNVIQSEKEMRDFLDFMEQSPDYHMEIIRASDEKDDGMAVIYKVK
jgi:predicted O-methyltransferase YrrM